MRTPRFSQTEVRVQQATWAFAEGRLEERALLRWALSLNESSLSEQNVIKELFDREAGIKQPYKLAWQCIFEFWRRPNVDAQHQKFLIKRELRRHSSPQEMINLIVEAIRPWLRVEDSERLYEVSDEHVRKRPKVLKDLLWPSIDSGERLGPEEVGLPTTVDRDYLLELAASLNVALLSGLNLARTVGLISEKFDITNAQVHRAYFVPGAEISEGLGEPDRYHKGFAPITKLLFAVVARLAQVDLIAAKSVITSWDKASWRLYRRLWAAAARDPNLATGGSVAEFLDGLDDFDFWRITSCPEIMELRALRWNSLPNGLRTKLEIRLLHGVSSRSVPTAFRDKPSDFRKLNTFVELSRIQAGKGTLSERAMRWLGKARLDLSDLPEVNVSYGFYERAVMFGAVEWPQMPPIQNVPNSEILAELANHLRDDDWNGKREQASNFVGANPAFILDRLEENRDMPIGDEVLRSLSFSFRPGDINASYENAKPEDLARIPIAIRLCSVLADCKADTLQNICDGIGSFMASWGRLLRGEPAFLDLWLAAWPIAVSRANELEPIGTKLFERAYDTPVGHLTQAFLKACPRIVPNKYPMSEHPWPCLLSAISDTAGEAKLQCQCLLIANLGYFALAAPEWTNENLIEPLQKASLHGGAEVELWEGFVHSNLPSRAVITAIGESMVSAATSDALSDEIREGIAARVVASAIVDRRDGAEAAIPILLVQQMLRMGGDFVRRAAVQSLKDFLKQEGSVLSADRFELIEKLFQDIWPKELTLRSRQVSEALADFPASAGEHFAEAVALVLPYLTPFDYWSLWNYGVPDKNGEGKQFSVINDPQKAKAFLSLLDRTIGGEDGAIIPNGLEDGLLHIAKFDSRLQGDPRFARLLTLSRRS